MVRKRAINRNVRFPLRDRLDALGWTQRRLATALKVSPSYVNSLCNGRVNPGWKLILRISRILSASLGDWEPVRAAGGAVVDLVDDHDRQSA